MSDWFLRELLQCFIKPVGRALVRYLRASALDKATLSASRFEFVCGDSSRILKTLDEDDFR